MHADTGCLRETYCINMLIDEASILMAGFVESELKLSVQLIMVVEDSEKL